MTNRNNNRMNDPTRQPGAQAAARVERRMRYQGMTPAEIVRGMSDGELARNARKGAPMAIYEQAYRLNAAEIYEHADELSEFESSILIEAEIDHAGGI